MQKTMSDEELSQYTNQIQKPSETFTVFLNHYITGSTWIRSRGEEDTSVWDKLKGVELEVAKQIILDGLTIVPDDSYMRAVSIFKDERAVPILLSIVDSSPHWDIKLLAAKTLHDLAGYKDYVPMLETACNNRNDKVLYAYLKRFTNRFISNLSNTDQARIWKALDESK